jgi:opacity protein-like surface antigen
MKSLTLLTLLAAVPVTTLAQETRGQGWEMNAEMLYQDAKDISFDGGSEVRLTDDFGFSFGSTYRFNERLELQFALDWQDIDYNVTIQSQSFPNIQFEGYGELESITPRVNVNFNMMRGSFTPYVTGGVGWTFGDSNIPGGPTQVGCYFDPWFGTVCVPYQSTKTFDNFIYQLGLGVRWDVSPGYTARFAYNAQWMDFDNSTSEPNVSQLKLAVAFRF